MSGHLKRGPDGHLLHGPTGHLVVDCGGGGCPCLDAVLPCDQCPGDTPTQFHVTFADVSICNGCFACGGSSVRIGGGSFNGTFVLAKNGACAWTAFSSDVPLTATLYASDDCSGDSVTISFAINQTRISDTQFRLQITDESNTMLVFDAIVTADACCTSYSVNNGLSACGCGGGGYVLGTGGMAIVTRC